MDVEERERWVHWWTGKREGDLVTVSDHRSDGRVRHRKHPNPTPASMRRLLRVVNYGRHTYARFYGMIDGWTAWLTGCSALSPNVHEHEGMTK